MKKLLFLTALFFMCNAVDLFAQVITIQQPTGELLTATSFKEAVTKAPAGSIVYLPGGSIATEEVKIDKKLSIIGVGHHPDSTSATTATYLNGNIILATGADNSYLSGFYLTGAIVLGDTKISFNISNITVTRCNVAHIYLNYDPVNYSSLGQNFNINECIIRGDFWGTNAKNCVVKNCIFQHYILKFNGANFFNCIFLINDPLNAGYINGGYYSERRLQNCLFQNCIFVTGFTSYLYYYISNCVFDNNIFTINQTIPWNGGTESSISGSGNIVNYLQTAIFENQTGNVFDYKHDYHLKATCAGKNKGTDRKDIGIYGGDGFKDGALPLTPHIYYKEIAPSTDANGMLKVRVKVRAESK